MADSSEIWLLRICDFTEIFSFVEEGEGLVNTKTAICSPFAILAVPAHLLLELINDLFVMRICTTPFPLTFPFIHHFHARQGMPAVLARLPLTSPVSPISFLLLFFCLSQRFLSDFLDMQLLVPFTLIFSEFLALLPGVIRFVAVVTPRTWRVSKTRISGFFFFSLLLVVFLLFFQINSRSVLFFRRGDEKTKVALEQGKIDRRRNSISLSPCFESDVDRRPVFDEFLQFHEMFRKIVRREQFRFTPLGYPFLNFRKCAVEIDISARLGNQSVDNREPILDIENLEFLENPKKCISQRDVAYAPHEPVTIAVDGVRELRDGLADEFVVHRDLEARHVYLDRFVRILFCPLICSHVSPRDSLDVRCCLMSQPEFRARVRCTRFPCHATLRKKCHERLIVLIGVADTRELGEFEEFRVDLLPVLLNLHMRDWRRLIDRDVDRGLTLR